MKLSTFVDIQWCIHLFYSGCILTTGSGGGIANESDLESEGDMCMHVCGCCATTKWSFTIVYS